MWSSWPGMLLVSPLMFPRVLLPLDRPLTVLGWIPAGLVQHSGGVSSLYHENSHSNRNNKYCNKHKNNKFWNKKNKKKELQEPRVYLPSSEGSHPTTASVTCSPTSLPLAAAVHEWLQPEVCCITVWREWNVLLYF